MVRIGYWVFSIWYRDRRFSSLVSRPSPLVSCLLSFIFFLTLSAKGQTDFTRYVDPFIGTGGHGHTYPGATLPFGMVQLSPDTRDDGSWDGCGGYHYSDSLMFGFSHTHLSGTGCSDYGDILLLPVKDSVNVLKKNSARFHHENEKASAGFYSVKLDNGITAELSATTRVGIHRYTFPKNSKPGILVDLMHRDKVLDASFRFVNKTTIEGYRRSEAWAKDQVVYFRIEFSAPYKLSGSRIDSLFINKSDEPEILKGNIRTWLTFGIKPNEPLIVKVSISGVSEEGAKKNMEAELPHWDFEKVKNEAHDTWQKELSKIEVSGGTEEKMKIFYTALYHTMIQPNIYNDVDGQYRGRDMKIHKAEGFNYYTVFSLWDTFRAWHPLMTIINRQRTLDFIKTFLAQYEQGGLLPVWELSSNETECMIGYHSVSVITDAAIKGITDFDMEEAFKAMKKSAESRDRYGLGLYIDKGCLSIEDESSSVSKTLEYAYDDWCIAQMAALLKHEKDYQYYMERSQYWKNLFDPQTGFIRPRKNGGWMEPFDPFEVNNNYTEANAWQYTFFVPQEIESMIQMSGGNSRFEKKLDLLFSAESKTTGREQADITGMIGQYAHGNEPSHHMAYLYNYVDKPLKTRQRVHQVLADFYHAAPDGLIGNEDCGQMSAWYVMSAMGLYQVCPGSLEVSHMPSFFPKIKVHFENGSVMELSDKDSTADKKSETKADRKSFGETLFSVIGNSKEFLFGRVATTTMNKENPYNSEAIETVPLIISHDQAFKGNMYITVMANSADDKIFYTKDGSTPDLHSAIYKSPIVIDSTATIKAIAVNKREVKSKISTAHFFKNPHPDWKISLLSKYSNQYTGGGDEATIDGIHGDTDWPKGNWQGYETDFECVIDLGKEQAVSKVGAEFLQDTRAWILMPKEVEFSFSTDGKIFSDPVIIKNILADKDYTTQLEVFSKNISSRNARYVKVKAVNYGKLPEWHQGAGGQAWIFVDEISVQ